MRATSWFISDYHFYHKNVLTYENRPFSDIKEHNQYIIDVNNSLVKENDNLYILGDVSFIESGVKLLEKLNGNKVLILGNHDKPKFTNLYLKYCSKVVSTLNYRNYLLSHIPIHPDSLGRYKGNIHGHLHSKILNDFRYLNVSVEQYNYHPISFEQIKNELNKKYLIIGL